MAQPEETIAPSEDRPIIVGGGPQMITIELPASFKSLSKKGKFSVAPKDAAVPFKSIVVTEGDKVVFSVALESEWTVRIE